MAIFKNLREQMKKIDEKIIRESKISDKEREQIEKKAKEKEEENKQEILKDKKLKKIRQSPILAIIPNLRTFFEIKRLKKIEKEKKIKIDWKHYWLGFGNNNIRKKVK